MLACNVSRAGELGRNLEHVLHKHLPGSGHDSLVAGFAPLGVNMSHGRPPEKRGRVHATALPSRTRNEGHVGVRAAELGCIARLHTEEHAGMHT